MATKSKSFRLVDDVADAFAEYCQRSGIIQERAVQALMVYAMTHCTAQLLGQMLDSAEGWIAQPQEARPKHPSDITTARPAAADVDATLAEADQRVAAGRARPGRKKAV